MEEAEIVVENGSEENISKITEAKAKISEELKNIEQSINEIDKIKNESIERIEIKKRELKDLSEIPGSEICKEHDETIKELRLTGKYIEDRQKSITLLDQTIAELDNQIAKIQVDHDKAVAELELKKRRLNEQLEYFEELNKRLEELIKLLQEESRIFKEKLQNLNEQRKLLLKRTDISETALNQMIQELDTQINQLNKEHECMIVVLSDKISEIALEFEPEGSELLTEEQLKELMRYEEKEEQLRELMRYEEREEQLRELMRYEETEETYVLTKEERLSLLRMGAQVTPSGRIITKDDKIYSYDEAREIGLLAYLSGYEDEEEGELEKRGEFAEKGLFYESVPSLLSASSESSTVSSALSVEDIEYLKRVFGKALTLALAEITAVQPCDPIHYLAHWLIKYRYNQEIDEIKRQELQALLIERERLAAEKWHTELEDEARLAVLEALFRAENIILQQEYARLAMADQEDEGGEDVLGQFNPLDFIF